MNSACYRPRVKAVIDEACALHGIEPEMLFVRSFHNSTHAMEKFAARRRKARWHIIEKFYDPGTAKPGGGQSRFSYGACELARILSMDHTSIIHAAKKMGIHPHAKQS